jgi:hypothetical protein
MPRPFEHWHVLPHGELTEVDAGILTVVGRIRMPLGSFPRRMTVVRLHDARLVVWSAIALDENEMAALEALGRPAFLVIPNDHHRLDAKSWKTRYPALQVVAPAGARANVDQIVRVDTTSPDFGDADVRFLAVAGTRAREAALVVRRPSGSTIVLNDLVGNVRDATGLAGIMFRLAGFAGHEPRIPIVVKRLLVDDARALREQLLEWAGIESLRRVLVSHGDPIEENPRLTLRRLAESL